MKYIIYLLLLSVCSSCASFQITSSQFAEQLRSSPVNGKSVSKKTTLIKYKSNYLDRIKCMDKKGNEVWLKVDSNTQVLLKRKDGSYIQGYFDTFTISNDSIFSVESRIAGGRHLTMLDQIENIKIKAEFPKTEPAH
ncbi:MAG: hypothetical protein K0Q95_2325 [Bacteroidota bacterium]|jgi:hypothetical protein|nr:hypothetical protein [Bacteroidota bacterium]